MINFGWSLPPGCTTLPGEEDDHGAEAFFDAFVAQAEMLGASPSPQEDALDKLAQWAWEQVGKAWVEGYQAGQHDEAVAEVHRNPDR